LKISVACQIQSQVQTDNNSDNKYIDAQTRSFHGKGGGTPGTPFPAFLPHCLNASNSSTRRTNGT